MFSTNLSECSFHSLAKQHAQGIVNSVVHNTKNSKSFDVSEIIKDRLSKTQNLSPSHVSKDIMPALINEIDTQFISGAISYNLYSALKGSL